MSLRGSQASTSKRFKTSVSEALRERDPVMEGGLPHTIFKGYDYHTTPSPRQWLASNSQPLVWSEPAVKARGECRTHPHYVQRKRSRPSSGLRLGPGRSPRHG